MAYYAVFKKAWLSFAVIFCNVFSTLIPAQAAAITSSTALPIGRGQFIVREQLLSQQATASSDRLRQNSVISTLVYGLSANWATFVNLPWSERRLDTLNGEVSNRGFGDASVFARYTAYQKNQLGKTLRIAPFFGLEAPTGSHSKRDATGALPPGLQNGSGEWDVFAGLVATYGTVNWTADIQLRYQHNRPSDEFEFGDVLRLDGSLQYSCLLYTSPSPRDQRGSRMPSSA